MPLVTEGRQLPSATFGPLARVLTAVLRSLTYEPAPAR